MAKCATHTFQVRKNKYLDCNRKVLATEIFVRALGKEKSKLLFIRKALSKFDEVKCRTFTALLVAPIAFHK